MQEPVEHHTIAISGLEVIAENEQRNLIDAIKTSLPPYEGSYQLERISGNLSPTARVFKLIAGTEIFVLRLLDIDRYFNDTKNEIQLITALSKQHIAPPIYHANEATGIVLMAFINEKPVFRGTLEESVPAIRALAKKISVLHALPLRPKPDHLLPSNLQKERLSSIYQGLQTHEPFQIYFQGIEYLNQISIFIRQESFCHNNLHKHNVMHDGRDAFIIDWETAGAGDAFLDLANFVILSRFSNEQETLFLMAYLD